MADLKDSGYNIYMMVLTRLPFLVDDSETQSIIEHYAWEMMAEMEPCFNVANAISPADPSRIGVEENYSMIQKMIVADLVAVYLLIRKAVAESGGDSGSVSASSSTAANRFMSKVKAGSVEVDYSQLKTKDSTSLAGNFESLRTQYRNSAVARAASIGCIIEVGADMTLISAAVASNWKAFIVINSCGNKLFY